MCRYSAHEQNRAKSFKTSSMTCTQKPALSPTPKLRRDVFFWIIMAIFTHDHLNRVFKSKFTALLAVSTLFFLVVSSGRTC